jgi:hypothetical protein
MSQVQILYEVGRKDLPVPPTKRILWMEDATYGHLSLCSASRWTEEMRWVITSDAGSVVLQAPNAIMRFL